MDLAQIMAKLDTGTVARAAEKITEAQGGMLNGQIWGLVDCDGVTVTGNVVPCWDPDDITFCRTVNCTSVSVSGNTNVGALNEHENI
jgi:hypothetical protein